MDITVVVPTKKGAYAPFSGKDHIFFCRLFVVTGQAEL